MVDRFKKGHWYRFNGKADGVNLNLFGEGCERDREKFMLDGKWHLCKENGTASWRGYFYDSYEPNEQCCFGDSCLRRWQKRLYMFDELPPISKVVSNHV